MKKLLFIIVIGMWATSLMAHSPLKTIIPSNKAIIDEVPSEVVLGFQGKIRLTRVKMKHAENPSLDLNLDKYSGFNSNYIIPIKEMGAGLYVIEWRGLGADGHALKGTFSFTVE